MANSILFNDGNSISDEKLVHDIIGRFVVGDEVKLNECVIKALSTIRSKKWKLNYPNIAFVHSINNADRQKQQVEIGFSLYAQALELIYLCISDSTDSYNDRLRFDHKLRVVFMYVYGWKMPSETADIVRIIRNKVMHTGSIMDISTTKQDEKAKIKKFFTKYHASSSVRMTDIQSRTHLIASFDYLMNDILLRIWGLRQDNLSSNGKPAWMNSYFGYIHGRTDNSKL
jgi:hypothetical protein